MYDPRRSNPYYGESTEGVEAIFVKNLEVVESQDGFHEVRWIDERGKQQKELVQANAHRMGVPPAQ